MQVRPDYAIGEIIEISGDPMNLRYCVKFDTGICASYYKNEIKLVDDKPYDRKTAFLRELQALLRKFDARIYDHDDYKLYVEIDHHRDEKTGFDNLVRIEYSDTNGELNADNIMDFDKD